MIDIVLVGTKLQGNLGACARVMKNFEFSKLVLLNPKCSIGKISRNRAKHAQDILKKATIKKESVLRNYDLVIGTTGVLGKDYNLVRTAISVKDMVNKIAKTSSNKIALLFGPEDTGLSNSQLRQCDIVVTIPASTKYATMNLSHSLTIILYEIYNSKKQETVVLASARDRQIIQKFIHSSLDTMRFTTTEKKETQKILWKRILGKAVLTKREAMGVMGYFRKLNQKK